MWIKKLCWLIGSHRFTNFWRVLIQFCVGSKFKVGSKFGAALKFDVGIKFEWIQILVLKFGVRFMYKPELMEASFQLLKDSKKSYSPKKKHRKT